VCAFSFSLVARTDIFLFTLDMYTNLQWHTESISILSSLAHSQEQLL
jgi:hypothetical protein